ncbi:uncharacterized protein A4U43_UnF7020 [Asparagus officinalis]|uniref:Uncharacterized protein n=1 Tax=Asparagus officinalis TaxID=4686 RepID=A0A1R3L6B2_ASPOF|nr:uncharacterized protein A4U43_UnF7020 [Asparagus officinalis]
MPEADRPQAQVISAVPPRNLRGAELGGTGWWFMAYADVLVPNPLVSHLRFLPGKRLWWERTGTEHTLFVSSGAWSRYCVCLSGPIEHVQPEQLLESLNDVLEAKPECPFLAMDYLARQIAEISVFCV